MTLMSSSIGNKGISKTAILVLGIHLLKKDLNCSSWLFLKRAKGPMPYPA